MDGIKAKVYTGNPAMIIDTWEIISPSNPNDNDFVVGDNQPNEGIHLDPGPSSAFGFTIGLIGPFKWTPTQEQAESNSGHRCVLAFIKSPEDPPKHLAPENFTDWDDVANDNNVAQRNIQIGTSDFPIVNPSASIASIGVRFDGLGFPFSELDGYVILEVEYNSILHSAWQDAEGIALTHDTSNNKLVVRFQRNKVVLPSAPLPGGTYLPATVLIQLPASFYGDSHTVYFYSSIDGQEAGGVGFTKTRLL